MSGDRVSERKNTAHRYRRFLPFVPLCKLCQLVLIYVNKEITGLDACGYQLGQVSRPASDHFRSGDRIFGVSVDEERIGGAKRLGANSEPVCIRTKLFDDARYFGPKRHRIGERQAAFASSDQCVPGAYTGRVNANQDFLRSRLRHIDVFHDNNVGRPRLVHSRCTHASPSLKAVSDGWSRLITPGICDWRNRIQGSVCAAAILAAYVRFGSKADITL